MHKIKIDLQVVDFFPEYLYYPVPKWQEPNAITGVTDKNHRHYKPSYLEKLIRFKPSTKNLSGTLAENTLADTNEMISPLKTDELSLLSVPKLLREVRALDAEAVHGNLAIQLPSLESSKLHVKDESKGKKGFSEEEV